MALRDLSLTGFLMGLVVISMFAGIFGLFISELVQTYNPGDTSYENISFYDKTREINTNLTNIKGNTTSIGLSSNPLDVVGEFFYNGYKVLKIIPSSFGLLETMGEQGLNDMHLGAGGQILKTALLSLVIVALFVGIILASLIKSDRI